ncbi:MAG TPA: DUF3696 domain-containing protein [Pyrinomonadaceae bacterium]|nr:DUF3696 domain-containing protein [Pyrinomonadaceae bacterium]
MAHRPNFTIRWKNFRGFRDTGWIEIRPLTILLGPNSSGKSSFVAPLLLMAQTLRSHDAETALVTRGPLIDAGRYSDLVYNHNANLNITFGLRFHVHDIKKRLKQIGEYPPGAIELIFDMPRVGTQSPRLKRFDLYDMYVRPFLRFSRRSEEKFQLSGPYAKGMTLPEIKAISNARPVNFWFTPANILRSRMTVLRRGKPDIPRSLPKFSHKFAGLLSAIGYASSEINNFLSRLTYIGPLRENPKRHYEAAGEEPGKVGPRGQYAPHLLRSKKNVRQAVNKWIRQFGLGIGFAVEEESRDIFSIVVKGTTPNVACNLADVGFGASQVFPLIVQAVASEQDGLTIAEQPEIHLNPRLQRVLADLLVSMANGTQHVIVETHSEHIMVRLRRLIAQKKIEAKDVGIYFIEKANGESIIRPIPVDSIGHIKEHDWPKEFFADALEESLGLAEAQQRSLRPQTHSIVRGRRDTTSRGSNKRSS